jgi:hypothetical protein
MTLSTRATRIVKSVLPEVEANGYRTWEVYAYLREFYGIMICHWPNSSDTYEIIDGQKYLFYLMKYPLD